MSGASPFWRRTPPALFPVCLGMIGIGLAWLGAAETLGAGPEGALGRPNGWAAALARIWIALSGVATLFCLGSYLAKLLAGPRVVLVDLNPAPGRAAVSAGSMCLMMLAAALARTTDATTPLLGLWYGGIGLHMVYALCVLYLIVTDGLRALRVTPVLFLPFVGFIVAPAGGVPLGQIALSHYIFWGSLPLFVLIFLLSAPRYLMWPTPVPQRAAAAILLAPASVFANAAHVLGMERIFDGFFVLSCVLAVCLLLGVRWLTRGGWTPLWGAFAFPSAAFAGSCVLAAGRYGGLWPVLAWAILVASTILVGWLFLRTMNAWRRGLLGPATGARVV